LPFLLLEEGSEIYTVKLYLRVHLTCADGRAKLDAFIAVADRLARGRPGGAS
jgi:hypothetical protein